MHQRINVANLPSGLNSRFAVFFVTALVIVVAFGQYIVPTSNVLHSDQAALSMWWGGIAGTLTLLGAIALYLGHPFRRMRAFGAHTPLDKSSNAAIRIGVLAERMNLELKCIRVDTDITNTDAIVFGIGKRKTLGIGRGLILLAVKKPADFDARLAHELGHIKNNDVGISMFADALATVSILAVLFVFCFGFATFGARAIEVWGDLKGQIDTSVSRTSLWTSVIYWFGGKSLSWVAFMAPPILLSAIVLFIEHRAFLRLRELLADAQAARWTSELDLVETLSQRTRERDSDRFGLFYKPFDAHPPVRDRIHAIATPEDIGIPKATWHLGLGYIIGMMLAFLSKIIVLALAGFEDLSTALGESYFNFLAAMVTSGSWSTIVSFLLSSLITYVVFISVSSAIIRQAIDAIIKRRYIGSAGRWLSNGFCLAVGIIAGSYMNPFAFAFTNNGMFSSPVFAGASVAALTFVAIFAFYVAALILALPLVRWILSGVRKRPVTGFEWASMFFLFAYAIAQTGLTLATYLSPQVAAFMGGPKGLITPVAWSIFWWTMVLGAGILARGGAIKSSRTLSPWLYVW